MSLSKEKAIVAGSVAVGALLLGGMYLHMTKSSIPDKKPEGRVIPIEEQKKIKERKKRIAQETLYKTEAVYRKKHISDVEYHLAVAFPKGGETFQGQVHIDFKLDEAHVEDLFVDFNGPEVKKMVVNGQNVEDIKALHVGQRIYLPEEHLVAGQNKVSIRYVASYQRDCTGIHYFKDTEDDLEYMYSQFEAADANKCFPCFDQPNLKAPYTFLVIAPSDWLVLSTTFSKDPSKREDGQFKQSLKDFDTDSELYESCFDKSADIQAWHFSKSCLLSTYLYSVVVGPYHQIDCKEKDDRIPLRFFCRQSLSKYVDAIADDWFQITKHGIAYYEEIFSCPYPFDKLDQTFIPDYNMGAMENVGNIIYTDTYVPRDEKRTDYDIQYSYNTLLHEISHMWFGNLVTMDWWDDLWLNESFANFISYYNMANAPGLEHIDLSWCIFLLESFWGLRTDQNMTTHPIACEVKHTQQAQDIFDGISYGKGAAFLKQMLFFLGDEVLKKGLKTYFAKYQFKNTKLEDFLQEMSIAAKEIGIKEDFMAWSSTWLKSSGCNIISMHYDTEEKDGKQVISKFAINQDFHIYGDKMLRKQKFQIALYDSEMKIIKIVDTLTDDKQADTSVDELVGVEVPSAFHINYQNHGYGKFLIDQKSLDHFHHNLHKIEDSFSRMQLYDILLDMQKFGHVSSYQVNEIIQANISHETATHVLQRTVESSIKLLLRTISQDLSKQGQVKGKYFDILLEILASGKFDDDTTLHMILENTINYATSEDQKQKVLQWYQSEQITDKDGNEIKLQISKSHMHEMVKKIYQSSSISDSHKKESLQFLEKIDSSDWMANTKAFCETCSPNVQVKRDAWNKIFGSKIDMNYHRLCNFLAGLLLADQYDLVKEFEDKFFEQIEAKIEVDDVLYVDSIFMYWNPRLNPSEKIIQQFKDLKKSILAKKPDDTHWTKKIDDQIVQQETIIAGRKLSDEYASKQN